MVEIAKINLIKFQVLLKVKGSKLMTGKNVGLIKRDLQKLIQELSPWLMQSDNSCYKLIQRCQAIKKNHKQGVMARQNIPRNLRENNKNVKIHISFTTSSLDNITFCYAIKYQIFRENKAKIKSIYFWYRNIYSI